MKTVKTSAIVIDAVKLYRKSREAKLVDTRLRARLQLDRLFAVMTAKAVRQYAEQIKSI